MNKLIIIGEYHASIFHKFEITDYVQEFKPDYLLCEFFDELKDSQIRDNINRAFSGRKYSFLYFPLFKCLLDSDSVLVGCDNLELKLKKRRLEEEYKYAGKSEKQALSKKLVHNNIDRELYFSHKIRKYLTKGSVLGIIGASHYYGILNDLKKHGITLNLLTNNESLIKEFNHDIVRNTNHLNALLSQFIYQYPIIGSNF